MSKITTTIPLTEEDKNFLESLVKTRTTQAQIVDRARMLLSKSEGKGDKFVAGGLRVSVNTVRRCTSRYMEGGLDLALYDDERSGRPVEITDDAISWLISIACLKPCEFGYAAELWTLDALHKHIQKNAEKAGYPRIAVATKPW